ncbi:bis(5'-nucleosyl)-tetraphosphatase (symmetrical) YqeK [Chamaesiphon polymorphus]|uniref:bis(5'-nucleosyl)-tetraphosphatase (symmetrical) n=1 Tax=Chamaesiphon polymorphus CCALA 037 TaxID=2107692 RepID=A0A2T1G049_9CYAN|nr:bis(5'-nucleosyl)-tetraphosphatase (symmetrical) YqeK [Chamaesiphon polymorphus]PSB50597.1 phosphohydrolase [Chamaesiphon polymorphus CCALA 037]
MRAKILAWLNENVPPKRIQHILGVERMAIELAEHYQLDSDIAAQAGLMHDLAKYFKPQRLLELARAEGLPIDEVDIAAPHLLHADVSAIVARDEFGITNPEILQAIADHTLGRPGMGAMSCIVFLADTLEAGRGDTPELESLRQLSYQDLHRAVWHTCDYSLQYLLSTRCLIHPRTIRTRNWAMTMSYQPVPT